MPNYPSQEILFHEGEGVDVDDMNNAQRFLRSQLSDLVVGGRVRFTEENHTPFFPVAVLALAGTAGAPIVSATPRQISNLPGVIAQASGAASTGADANVLLHYVAAGELAVTLDVGDALPRLDMILVKLEHDDDDPADAEARTVKDYATGTLSTATFVKRRKVISRVSVVKGTPAATPALPTPTSGWAIWCVVYVPAGHSSTIDVDNVHDWRSPLGLDRQCLPVDGLGAGLWSASGWEALTSSPGVISTGVGVLYVSVSSRSRFAGRLSRLTIMGQLAGCTIQLVRLNHDNSASFGGATVIADVSAAFTGGLNRPYALDTFFDASGVAVPVWLNGSKAGIATVNAPKAAPNDGRMHTLAIKITSGGAGAILRFIDADVLAA